MEEQILVVKLSDREQDPVDSTVKKELYQLGTIGKGGKFYITAQAIIHGKRFPVKRFLHEKYWTLDDPEKK